MIHFLPTFIEMDEKIKHTLLTYISRATQYQTSIPLYPKISCSTRHHQHFEVKDDVGAQISHPELQLC